MEEEVGEGEGGHPREGDLELGDRNSEIFDLGGGILYCDKDIPMNKILSFTVVWFIFSMKF